MPTFTQSGIYTVDFIVEDPSGLLMRDAATITIAHIDRKPELVEIDDKTVDENTELTFTLEGSDLDEEDQQVLSYTAENLPEGAIFDATTAAFTWTPTFDQSGEYDNILFVFTAGGMSDSTTIKVIVNHVNRSPVFDIIADQLVNENDSLSFVITGSDPDVEDEGKLIFSASNLPDGASFSPSGLSFSWTPTFVQSGEYAESNFMITDPSGLSDSKLAKITVSHVNRTPALTDIASQTLDENTPLEFDLVGMDPDSEDAGKLTYTATGLPEGAVLSGTKVTWTPTYDQSGSYDITYTVADAEFSVSKSAPIVINHVNRNPVMDAVEAQTVAENAALTFSVTGSDPDTEDAGKFVISSQNMPEGATFDAATGAVNWTPTFEQSGAYSITFINTDPAGLTNQTEAKVSVNHVNRTPVFEAQPAQTVDENITLNFKLIPATDPDKEDAQKLVYVAADLPEGSTFDGATQAFSWTPSYDQSGSYTVNFTLTDGEFPIDQAVAITVNHVNRAPKIDAISAQTANENSAFSLSLNVMDDDSEDAGKLVTAITGLPEGATFDATSNSISWTPTFEQSGNYTGIKATVADPAGLSMVISFDITVNHVNRNPLINEIAAIAENENQAVTFAVSGSDPDFEDQEILNIAMSGEPNGASFDGSTFSWTPSFEQAGSHTITFTISDGNANASTTADVTIANVNRDPEISGDTSRDVEAGSSISLSFTGSDPDDDNLAYSLTGAPSGMSVDGSGTVSWTPGDDQVGSHSVTIVTSDGTSEASASFSVMVTAKPAPPPPAPETAPSDSTEN